MPQCRNTITLFFSFPCPFPPDRNADRANLILAAYAEVSRQARIAQHDRVAPAPRSSAANILQSWANLGAPSASAASSGAEPYLVENSFSDSPPAGSSSVENRSRSRCATKIGKARLALFFQ